ncbi:SDR family NAD(P)-dependent oxidoreductase, partial [Micromonospora sp. NPDC048839]|uniref:type I polyketide synthase n=1 Tax=Micromonospora sp. NPDC048839 TaxID=3155641 RepID=UPI00340EC94E
AEVELPDGTAVTGFGLHPALFDAALHAIALGAFVDADRAGPWLPFVWSGVNLHATGASVLRVRLTPAGTDAITLLAVDASGVPVLSVDSLALRPADLTRMSGTDHLFAVDWVDVAPVSVGVGSGEVFEVVVLERVVGGVVDGVRAVVGDVLGRVQSVGGGRLVVVARGMDVVSAAVFGLVRSAQSESPGRFVLVDVGDVAVTDELVAGAVGVGEPELRLWEGVWQARRLVRGVGGVSVRVPAAGTVLVTGGTGALGGLLARHLVVEHGVRSLVLTSRRGLGAAGALGLVGELEGLGAVVRVVACDVGVRAAVAGLVEEIGDLCGVVHAAGVLDDGLVGSLSPERVGRVFGPKVDAGWYLHELTAGRDLDMFVVFSSAAGVVGNVGQGSYAAANGFLDELIRQRNAAGLVGTSLAWGLWDQAGMGAGVDGVPGLSAAEGLALFDVGWAQGGVLVPMRLDLPALRAGGDVPPLFRSLVRGRTRRTAQQGNDAADWSRRLAPMTPEERHETMLRLVRTAAAGVLGYAGPEAVGPAVAFKELGFDSLTAVELRNQLSASTGLRLPATLVFDQPNPAELAEYLIPALLGGAAGPDVDTEIDALEALLDAVDVDSGQRSRITTRLQTLLTRWADQGRAEPAGDGEVTVSDHLEQATDEEIFQFIGREFGIS